MTRRYLLGAGPAQDFLLQRRGVQERVEPARRAGATVGSCVPVPGQVVAGPEGRDTREAAWAVARRRLGLLVCWPYDPAAAHEYGRLFAVSRRMGRPTQQVDLQVAAIARTLGNGTVVDPAAEVDGRPEVVGKYLAP